MSVTVKKQIEKLCHIKLIGSDDLSLCPSHSASKLIKSGQKHPWKNLQFEMYDPYFSILCCIIVNGPKLLFSLCISFFPKYCVIRYVKFLYNDIKNPGRTDIRMEGRTNERTEKVICWGGCTTKNKEVWMKGYSYFLVIKYNYLSQPNKRYLVLLLLAKTTDIDMNSRWMEIQCMMV